MQHDKWVESLRGFIKLVRLSWLWRESMTSRELVHEHLQTRYVERSHLNVYR